TWQQHAFDTIKGSDYLADQDAAEILCREAPGTVIEMEHWGTLFSRTNDGKIAQRPFGGAGIARACYAADRTGHSLLHTLFDQMVKRQITVMEDWLVLSLIADQKRCHGVVAINLLDSKVEPIRTNAVVLATGGYGRVYDKTTNALINTGSGIGMAYRAGVPIEDMEFVQFHPTSLYGTNILITEGARGEGGYLINNRDERFMEKYAPEKLELAPRDVVSQAIQTEVNEGRGFENEYVHIDLRHLGADKIKERLPEIREIAMDFAGVDPIEEPIPIQPAQHYSMGGISVNSDCETEIAGLFAAGECACISVHGANRLGGNSLLEALVFGKIAGANAAEFAMKNQSGMGLDNFKQQLTAQEENIERFFSRETGENLYHILNDMKKIMTEHVGVFRDRRRLEVAIDKLIELQMRNEDVFVRSKVRRYNAELRAALELSPMLEIAEVIATCALKREESRGAHKRVDFPDRNDNSWLKHSVITFASQGHQIHYKEPVITSYQPTERTY
ncbi:FAD-binding protein, partial [candidate division KSB1 bacterium]|nr:FAD-binding protein [candidate division KSB1 bacterium]